MEDHSSVQAGGNFAENSCRVLDEEAALRRFRIRLHNRLRNHTGPSKSMSHEEKLFDSDLVEEAVLNSWEKIPDKTPEEFAARMLEILDKVIDEAPGLF
jgi:hypothetical protein